MGTGRGIADITPLTLLDFPNKVACIFWLRGCNLFCQYCYNVSLVRGTDSPVSYTHLLPVKKIVAGKLVFPIHKLQITAVSGIGRQFYEHGRRHKQGVRPAPAVLAARSQELEGSGGRPVHHLVQHGANLFSCGGIAVFHRHLHPGMPHGMVVRMIMPVQGLSLIHISNGVYPMTRNFSALVPQRGHASTPSRDLNVSPQTRHIQYCLCLLYTSL